MATSKVPNHLRRYTDFPALLRLLHASLSKATVAAIRGIAGCGRLRVSRSTLISNEQWTALGQAAT